MRTDVITPCPDSRAPAFLGQTDCSLKQIKSWALHWRIVVCESMVDLHHCPAFAPHAQSFGRSLTQVNDEALTHRTPIIDPDHHFAAVQEIDHPNTAAQGCTRVRCGESMSIKALPTGCATTMPALTAVPSRQPLLHRPCLCTINLSECRGPFQLGGTAGILRQCALAKGRSRHHDQKTQAQELPNVRQLVHQLAKKHRQFRTSHGAQV